MAAIVSGFAAFCYAMAVWWFISGTERKAARKMYSQPQRSYINKRTIITAMIGAKLTLLLVWVFTRWPDRVIWGVAIAVGLLVVSVTAQALWEYGK